MRLHGLILFHGLAATLVAGCIDTKDMGEDTDSVDDAGSDSGSDSGMTAPPGDDGATSSPMSAGDTGTTASDPDSGPATTAMTTGADPSTTSMTTDDGDSGSTSAGGDDQTACEATGGTWHPESCGHYGCGVPPACAAVIPGCDCGPAMNFEAGTGCVEDPICLQATFDCGDLACTTATEYCEVLYPGVPGPLSYACNDLPAACIPQPTCMCLEDEGIAGGPAQCTELPDGGLQIEIFTP